MNTIRMTFLILDSGLLSWSVDFCRSQTPKRWTFVVIGWTFVAIRGTFVGGLFSARSLCLLCTENFSKNRRGQNIIINNIINTLVINIVIFVKKNTLFFTVLQLDVPIQ